MRIIDTIMYTEDPTTFWKSDCLAVLENTMDQATVHIMNWFTIDKLHFHQNKFQYLNLGLIQNTEH